MKRQLQKTITGLIAMAILSLGMTSCSSEESFFDSDQEARLQSLMPGNQFNLIDQYGNKMIINMNTFSHNEQVRSCIYCSNATEYEYYSFQYDLTVNGIECNGAMRVTSEELPTMNLDGVNSNSCDIFGLIAMCKNPITKTVGDKVFNDVITSGEVDFSISHGIIRVREYAYFDPDSTRY